MTDTAISHFVTAGTIAGERHESMTTAIPENGNRASEARAAGDGTPRALASAVHAYALVFAGGLAGSLHRRPTERALALVAYLQWLGSWVPPTDGARP
jgi:hypothetical protein